MIGDGPGRRCRQWRQEDGERRRNYRIRGVVDGPEARNERPVKSVKPKDRQGISIRPHFLRCQFDMITKEPIFILSTTHKK